MKSSGKGFPSLYQLSLKVLLRNIDALGEIGDVPREMLEPLFAKCNWKQLASLEYYNPHLIEGNEKLWETHAQKVFAKELGSSKVTDWRCFFLKCLADREERMKEASLKLKEESLQHQQEMKARSIQIIDASELNHQTKPKKKTPKANPTSEWAKFIRLSKKNSLSIRPNRVPSSNGKTESQKPSQIKKLSEIVILPKTRFTTSPTSSGDKFMDFFFSEPKEGASLKRSYSSEIEPSKSSNKQESGSNALKRTYSETPKPYIKAPSSSYSPPYPMSYSPPSSSSSTTSPERDSKIQKRFSSSSSPSYSPSPSSPHSSSTSGLEKTKTSSALTKKPSISPPPQRESEKKKEIAQQEGKVTFQKFFFGN